MTKEHKKSLIIAALAIILMSIESPIMKFSAFNAQNIAFYLGISLFISANFIMIAKGRNFFINSYKQNFLGVFLSGFFAGLGNFFFIQAIIYAGVATTVLILATTPIFSSIITWLVFKQKVHKNIFIAMFFIFIGLYLILEDDFQQASFLGIVYAFICMFSMIFLLSSLKYFPKSSTIGYISIGGVFLFLLSLINFTFEYKSSGILYILFLGLITMPLARYLLGNAAKKIYPQEMSLLMILESALAPLLAWWWLDEALELNTVIGGAIIFLTLIIYFLAPKR